MAAPNCPACGSANEVPPGHNLPTLLCAHCGASYGLLSGALVAPPQGGPVPFARPDSPFFSGYAGQALGAPGQNYVPPPPGTPLPKYTPPMPVGQAGYPSQVPPMPGYYAPQPWAQPPGAFPPPMRRPVGPPRMPVGTMPDRRNQSPVVIVLLAVAAVVVLGVGGAVWHAATSSVEDDFGSSRGEPPVPLRGKKPNQDGFNPDEPTVYQSTRWGFEVVFPASPKVDASAVSSTVSVFAKGVSYTVITEDHTRDGDELLGPEHLARIYAGASAPEDAADGYEACNPVQVSGRKGFRATHRNPEGTFSTALAVLDNRYVYIVVSNGHAKGHMLTESFLMSFKLLRPQDAPQATVEQNALRLQYVGSRSYDPGTEYAGTLVALGGAAGEPVQWEVLESRLPAGFAVSTEDRRLVVQGTTPERKQAAFLRVKATVGEESAILEIEVFPRR